MKELTLFEKLHFKEFSQTPQDMEKRHQLSYSDEFVFRKAKIYKVLGPRDDRLQVHFVVSFLTLCR
jgi:hypothetical protein